MTENELGTKAKRRTFRASVVATWLAVLTFLAAIAAVPWALSAGADWADGLAQRGNAAPVSTTSPAEVDDGSRKVRYEVLGTARGAHVTARTPTGVEQGQNRAVPLRVEYTFGVGDSVYISAQNSGDEGKITCSILAHGKVISENTSVGPYAVVSCEGRVP